MPQRSSHLDPSVAQSELAASLADLKLSLDAPKVFPVAALEEAQRAHARVPDLDLREVPFVTLDPPGSMDLDQAFHLETVRGGYLVRYAIADVPAFVRPASAIDLEARLRGQTLYAADGAITLHPRALCENRASLLANVDRPALVWSFKLDPDGSVSEFRLERALIRSRARLDYLSVQRDLDMGLESPATLLAEIGPLRQQLEDERGGASLNLPEETVVRRQDGTYGIERRQPLPVEEWNAQISLMTGMAAAELMLDARIGILRTMPRPSNSAFEAFRRQTRALGRPWVTGDYGEYLRGLDRNDPVTLPILVAASSLFRGAGYEAFDGETPTNAVQAALAAPYAHTTAPLRRLVDRWALAICADIAEGREIQGWARDGLAELPAIMKASGQRASQLNSATINAVEAAVLAPLVGSTFRAMVIELRGDNSERATIQIADPAVTESVAVPRGAKPGDFLTVRLLGADIQKGRVEFEVQPLAA